MALPVTERTLICIAVFLVVAHSIAPPPGFAQSAALEPKFEVASIKQTKECRGGSPVSSPDGLSMHCYSLRNLILRAYGQFASSREDFLSLMTLRVEGGPSWIRSVGYDIQAKADGPVSRERMNGPMLRNLLEDRFQLKVHRETKELPIYALTVAKGGSKLKPFVEGSCTPFDPASGRNPFPRTPDSGERPFCLNTVVHRYGIDSNTLEIHGGDMKTLVTMLGSSLDRPLIDRTGLTGKFDIRMEFAPGETHTVDGVPIPPAALGRTVFTAVQEALGLRLEPTRGPVEVLVIDSAERPSEN